MEKYFEGKLYSMNSDSIEIGGKKMCIASWTCDETFYRNVDYSSFDYCGTYDEKVNEVYVHDYEFEYGHIFIEFMKEEIKITVSYFEISKEKTKKYENAVEEINKKWNAYMSPETIREKYDYGFPLSWSEEKTLMFDNIADLIGDKDFNSEQELFDYVYDSEEIDTMGFGGSDLGYICNDYFREYFKK